MHLFIAGSQGTLGVIVNNAQNLGGPVPTRTPVFLSDFATSSTRVVPGIHGLFWGRGTPPLSPQAHRHHAQPLDNALPAHREMRVASQVDPQGAHGHPGEESGGFPWHSTIEQEAEELVGRLKVVHGVCGWAPRQLDGEVRRGGWKLAAADFSIALVSVQASGMGAQGVTGVEAEAVWSHIYDSSAALDAAQLIDSYGLLQTIPVPVSVG